MKVLLKKTTEHFGGHLYSHDSLPTGVDWLHDIRRAGAVGAQPVCFDVGANVGQTVAELRRAFRGAVIHAFEPFSAPRSELAATMRSDPRVTVMALAMGSSPGVITVRPHAVSLMSSLRGADDSTSDLPSELIQIDTLDAYCARENVEHIDILKTDTEGHDLEVLRGAAALLAAQRVGYVYVEVTFTQDNRQNTAFAPTFEYLSSHGMRFLGLYETYPLHHYEEPIVFCNALFVAATVREQVLARRRAIP